MARAACRSPCSSSITAFATCSTSPAASTPGRSRWMPASRPTDGAPGRRLGRGRPVLAGPPAQQPHEPPMIDDRSAPPSSSARRSPALRSRAAGPLLAACLAILTAAPAQALDLREAYEAAQRYDAQLNSARLQLEAVRERLPQARAGLKPSLGAALGANAGRYDTDITPQRSFDNIQGALNFAFPLYRPGNAALVDQAEISVRLAEAQLGLAAQDLVTRVAIAYFEVLAARDAVEVAEAQRRAIS